VSEKVKITYPLAGG